MTPRSRTGNSLRWLLLAVIAGIAAAVAAACRAPGRGPAPPATCEVWVTRDYGAALLKQARTEVSPEETVMDVTGRVCRVETAYGGGFVRALDGLASTGRRSSQGGDWFYYVDGVLEGRGALETRVPAGSIVWWDYHNWSGGGGILTALVGAWPRPLDSGGRILFTASAASYGRRLEEAIGSAGGRCSLAAYAGESLENRQSPTLLVGLASEVLDLQWLSGLFRNAWRAGLPGTVREQGLVGLDAAGREVFQWRDGAALIIATGSYMGDRKPLWLVVGWDETGLETAVTLLTGGSNAAPRLEHAFGLAVTPAGTVRLPIDRTGGGAP
ncbi:MAG: DUF4430 domain-containing protein [Ignavibacteriales bacterium]